MAKIDLSKSSSSGSSEMTWMQKLSEFMNKDYKLGSDSLPNSFKERLYSDLHLLVSSGLDLRSALELLSEESTQEKEKTVLAEVKKGVFAGRPLADVFQETKGFTEYEVFSIRIGEETGSISEVMGNLSVDFRDRIRLKRELITAFSYPLIITAMAFGAVAFMLTFVVPVFSDLFNRMGKELPWITQKIVGLSEGFGDYWWLILLLLLTIVVSYIAAKKNEKFNSRLDYALMRVPWIGPILRESKLARFSGSMGFMLGANVNLLRSMKLSADMTAFAPISEAVHEVEKGLIQGESLRELMGRHKVFDSRFIAMIKVGEEVNQLGQIFKHLSNQYGEQVQRETKLLSMFIEPIMIGLLGVLVGIILVAMYLPVFEMNSSF